MKKTSMESRLRVIAEKETPDVLGSVFRELGKEPMMELTVKKNPEGKKAARPFLRRMGSLAAAAALAVGVYGCYIHYSVDAVVGIDVNPSLELRVNRGEKVLSANALNEDARIVLEGMKLENVDVDVAVNAVIGSMLKNGYLGEGDNAINICVEDDNAARGEALSKKLTREVHALLASKDLDGTVKNQTREEDKALEKQAEENHVSVGKAALAQLVVAESGGDVAFEEAAKMSVKELWAIAYPEDVTFITLDEAVDLVLEKADVTSADVVKDRLYKKGTVYIYDLELKTDTHRYRCEIEAINGTVLTFDEKELPVSGKPSAPEKPSKTEKPSVSDERIPEAKAQEIAFADAGVKAELVKLQKCKLDEDDGRWVYEVDFKAGKDKYDYEIDAVSGAILSRKIDLAEKAAEPEMPQTPAVPELLAEKKVLSSVYKDAGVKEKDVILVKCELDEDDSFWVYEVEFYTEDSGYDYEVNAENGEILSRDTERFEKEGTGDEKDKANEKGEKKENRKQSKDFVTEEKALKNACKTAEVKQAEASGVECELDEEDGVWIYELSFRVGRAEYEFEIDAQSGDVLAWQQDN